jgi:hypothetical protein
MAGRISDSGPSLRTLTKEIDILSLGVMRKVVALALLVASGTIGCLNEDHPGGSTDVDSSNSAALDGLFMNSDSSYPGAWLFSPQGDFAFISRLRGLVDEFTFANAEQRGKWRIEGQQVFLTDDTTPPRESTGRLLSPDRIRFGDPPGYSVTWTRVPKIASDVDLRGSFRMTTGSVFGTDSAGGSDGFVNGDHYIKFTEGTVDILDSVGVFINGEYLVSEKEVVGSYSIDGHTMVIVEGGGMTTRHNFWVADGSPSAPHQIAFDKTVYVR